MLAVGQDQPTPKAEFYGGYSWLGLDSNTYAGTRKVPPIKKGIEGAATLNLNKWVGLTADYSGHFSSPANVNAFEFGPQLKFRSDQISPFVHALVGFANISSPGMQSKLSVAVSLGGGFDLNAGRYLDVRVLQVDYQYLKYGYRWDGPKIGGGLVFKLNPPENKVPPSATCSLAPTEIMAGDPVKASVSTSNFNPKRTVSYEWSTTGGKVEGSGTAVTVDTTGLAPGDYTVGARATDNGKGKKQMSASCDSKFTVKEPPKHPPVMSCSAMPTTVRAGDPVTVSAQANSPDNRPLSYSWTTSAGRISGSGANVTLDTAGLSAGPVTVNGTVTDDRGLSASCSTGATVEVPPPPPEASKINTIAFPDKRRPARVDNTAKAILDEVALRLQRDADSTAVVVGYASADEVKPKYKRMKAKMTAEELAAQRAVNTKEYLTKEKGIDPSRIKVATGTGDEAKADIWIVPQGATFNEPGTTMVDESVVKPTPEKRVVYHKRVVKKAPAKK